MYNDLLNVIPSSNSFFFYKIQTVNGLDPAHQIFHGILYNVLYKFHLELSIMHLYIELNAQD